MPLEQWIHSNLRLSHKIQTSVKASTATILSYKLQAKWLPSEGCQWLFIQHICRYSWRMYSPPATWGPGFKLKLWGDPYFICLTFLKFSHKTLETSSSNPGFHRFTAVSCDQQRVYCSNGFHSVILILTWHKTTKLSVIYHNLLQA
jgi:hypothetical protein